MIGGGVMGILDWLFGSKAQPQPGPLQWQRSENGNPTMLWDGLRITVFQQDRGWKYLIAPEDDSAAPFYSERFKTQQEAMAEAVAHAEEL